MIKRSNSVDVSPISVISPIFFHLNRMGNGNDNISSEEHFEIKKTVKVLTVFRPISFYFFANI